MPLSEHPLFPRFPSQIIGEGAHSPFYAPYGSATGDMSSRLSRQSRPYFKSDLSECTLTRTIKNTLFAILMRQGGMRPVLNHVEPFCEIGIETDENDFNGNALVDPQPLGVVTNSARTFKLRKRMLIEGYENEETYYYPRYPHIDFRR